MFSVDMNWLFKRYPSPAVWPQLPGLLSSSPVLAVERRWPRKRWEDPWSGQRARRCPSECLRSPQWSTKKKKRLQVSLSKIRALLSPLGYICLGHRDKHKTFRSISHRYRDHMAKKQHTGTALSLLHIHKSNIALSLLHSYINQILHLPHCIHTQILHFPYLGKKQFQRIHNEHRHGVLIQ